MILHFSIFTFFSKLQFAFPHPLALIAIWRVLGTKNELYDIGAKILFVQCFVTTDMFLFCKPIIFRGNCRICRDLAFGSVKTRFKAIFKKLDFSAQIVQIVFSAQIDFFMNFCPRRATKLRSL